MWACGGRVVIETEPCRISIGFFFFLVAGDPRVSSLNGPLLFGRAGGGAVLFGLGVMMNLWIFVQLSDIHDHGIKEHRYELIIVCFVDGWRGKGRR